MSAVSNSIGLREGYTNYFDFPDQMPLKAAQGFIVTAAISLFFRNPVQVALLGGTIAATATLIEGVTRPIIHSIFPEHAGIVRLIQLVIPKIMASGLASSLAPWIGVSYKMTSYFIPLIGWFALNNGVFEKNVAIAEVL